MKTRHEIFSTIIWDYKNKEEQSISPNPLYSTNARHMNEAEPLENAKKDVDHPIYLLLVLPLPRLPAVSHLASEAVV
jgi:hypothetical protein